jgi:hypothetical protein
MLPDNVWRMTMWWGPGALLLVILAYGALRLARLWIEESMNSKRRQMETLLDMLRQYVEQFLGAQKSQADALARLATSVERSDSRESLEHQQILIALKALHKEVESLSR